MPDSATDLEPVEDFRRRLRAWLPDHMPAAGRRWEAGGVSRGTMSDEEELADVAHTRQLQRTLFDGGFAGICFPREYGGQGLTPAHQQVFNEEIVGFDFPARIQVPTFQPCATVILDFGTEEQKKLHLPAILKGDEIWMQFLSEPTGGSDVAGAQTTAVRDGEEWVLNGSKIWTTGAWWSDWGLCLARTNWDVPKHRGLTVFMLRIHQPGIEVHRIEMLNGSREFCQEFMTDVRVPDHDRVGQVDDGWTVGTRWMFYEKSFGISFYTTRPAPRADSRDPVMDASQTLLTQALARGRLDDPVTRELIGEAHALSLVMAEANRRIGTAISTGKMSDQGAGLSKVLGGSLGIRVATINFQVAGASAGAWTDDTKSLGYRGLAFLTRQAGQIAGGTVEMSRNVVSERLLGMPRERTNDRDVAFRNVPRAAPSR
jgi:alkylation response protein AidB-like acyl-CoA dehydrogenase